MQFGIVALHAMRDPASAFLSHARHRTCELFFRQPIQQRHVAQIDAFGEHITPDNASGLFVRIDADVLRAAIALCIDVGFGQRTAQFIRLTLPRLRDYMLGQGDLDGLRIGLLKLLEALAKERAGHRRRAEETKRRIQALRQQPSDEATQAEIDEMTRERDSGLGQAKEIGARELLGTLTDAGLIPNYAFPEAGVELKSLLWRKRSDGEEGTGAYITLPAQTYERPASSALSEFAPENRFYANRRSVEIDQVNMDLAKAEQWRLCPACHHMENLEHTGDAHETCPRCGDAMWANVTQQRTLLRFRQAMANANDKYSRIDDSSDDREPRFFLRQLLVDFEPDAVEIAWKLESDALAFGFEFIRHANFRDINFGEKGKAGETFRVADRESVRPGFKLCRYCGMVQKPPRRKPSGEAGPAQNHVRDCQAYGSDDPKHIINCLYLYREFASEALRILVPYTRSGLDETVWQAARVVVLLAQQAEQKDRWSAAGWQVVLGEDAGWADAVSLLVKE